MRMLKRSESGFTLIELLIVVAILGILAAVVVPNVGRFLGRGETEARDTEYQNVLTAVSSMMVDNSISTLNDPVNEAAEYGGGCTTGTTLMSAFPDADTVPTVKDNYLGGAGNDALDGAGWKLFGHDFIMNGANPVTAQINYMASAAATNCYAVAADGTVSQYNAAGTLLNGPGV